MPLNCGRDDRGWNFGRHAYFTRGPKNGKISLHSTNGKQHVKFIYSYNTKQNERREGLTISAPNRDAAFSELNKRGIRPFKLQPAPGLCNKLSAYTLVCN